MLPRKIAILRNAPWTFLFAAALLTPTLDASAGNGITVETVNNYDWWCTHGLPECCASPSPCNTACNTEGNGFWYVMTNYGTGWTAFDHWTDTSVYDVDFHDPDRPGSSPWDADTWNFDQAGNAISFVCAHGVCDDCTATNCTAGWQCGRGSECMNNPPSAYSSRCANGSARRLVTASSTNYHGNYVFYGNGAVKWGESPNSGAWAGAGTNGGTNVVFLENSCGLRPYFWSQMGPAFAGAHLIAAFTPVSNVAKGASSLDGCADAVNSPTRGSVLANLALANPYGSISDAWASTRDQMPQTDGASCPDLTTTYTYGGGHGIGGCGAYAVLSYDSTQALANWHVDSESWMGARWDTNDATGNGYLQWKAHCNYDCVTYPFTK